jgi:hypothetical protein
MSNVSARSVLAADRRRRAVLFAAVLVALARVPRNRRFQEHAITLAIGLAAAAAIGRENQARTLARLAAWDQRQNLRYPKKSQA